MFIEEVGRYVDGTLQDRDVHTRDVEFTRVPNTGRDVDGGWACDFDVLFQGRRIRITVGITATSA
jgi:hypothetical protein